MGKKEKGKAISPGFGEGHVFVLASVDFREIEEGEDSRRGKYPSEKERLGGAMEAALKELDNLHEKVVQSLGKSKGAILEAHRLMLQDPILTQKIEEHIQQGESAPNAVYHATMEVRKMFEALPDPYLRERAADVFDVGRRLYEVLLGKEAVDALEDGDPRILVTRELTPSDAMNLDAVTIRGIVTQDGGPTSHTALVAQSLEIPGVSGVERPEERFSSEDYLCVNGQTGEILRNPSEQELNDFRRQVEHWQEEQAYLESLKAVEPVTRDGCSLFLWGNLADPGLGKEILKFGGAGVGLFRTEFLFMGAQKPLREEEQLQKYQELLQTLHPFPGVIRTLDAGGDKEIPFIQQKVGEEANPFLGYRAIRICLDEPDIFYPQLRALLRAAVGGNLWVMFPMITGVEELRKAKTMLHRCAEELEKEGVPWAFPAKTGIMVETPAAVAMAPELAKDVDFFSVGTNDLTQYVLACDRMNRRLTGLYSFYHPGVVRLLKKLGDVAVKEQKDLGMCGEMAGDPLALPLLVGMGFREFSMTPSKIPRMKKTALSLSLPSCENLAREVLSMETTGDVVSCLEAFHEQLDDSKTQS